MRVLIDACVLYPTVMREVVLGAARQGLFQPLWSERLLEEWARAAARRGPVDEVQARGEVALVRAAWPEACVTPRAGDMARIWLPDPNDVHVLAAAIAGSADLILTSNAKDFPRNVLREEGLDRRDPDGFLHDLWLAHPEKVAAAAREVLLQAQQMDDVPHEMRPLLKKARLPRLAKALSS
ncbi:RSP_2648 family PIN domain-containing protein [Tropicimonas marinistellae]|uniref:RSP_2648 family PIN domain-containing protein n=1 Tax=Tropicimonas marinistellae TaxID=1739787 RepID=UPI0008376BD8|nr:PIN domain-containing protein [Tropicimonas marinistellae]